MHQQVSAVMPLLIQTCRENSASNEAFAPPTQDGWLDPLYPDHQGVSARRRRLCIHRMNPCLDCVHKGVRTLCAHFVPFTVHFSVARTVY